LKGERRVGLSVIFASSHLRRGKEDSRGACGRAVDPAACKKEVVKGGKGGKEEGIGLPDGSGRGKVRESGKSR